MAYIPMWTRKRNTFAVLYVSRHYMRLNDDKTDLLYSLEG